MTATSASNPREDQSSYYLVAEYSDWEDAEADPDCARVCYPAAVFVEDAKFNAFSK